MMRRRVPIAGLALLVGAALASGGSRLGAVRAADTLPARLTDAQFWALSDTMSEPNGYFRSDNLLSNELYYPQVLPDLLARVKPGGVYLGVGPEQNFNYIVAIRPKMAFITDIRRGNLHMQLVYKALFEMSADRADFVSRLFTKPRPAGLTAASTATQLMQAYWDVETSAKDVFDRNLQAIKDHLTRTHALPLSPDDLDGIDYVYGAFYWYGPSITYNSSNNNGFGRGGNMSTYAQLMTAADDQGREQSYLASEAGFRFMKDLEQRNMVVPLVGNFGGSRALRAIGQYVRDHHATIGAFYLSNVEQYLQQDGIWGAFCGNVASMPLDPTSTFIRSQSWGGGGFRNSLGNMQAETDACAVPSRGRGGR
jgi:hypothetical protein